MREHLSLFDSVRAQVVQGNEHRDVESARGGSEPHEGAHLPSAVERGGLLGLDALKILQLGVCQLGVAHALCQCLAMAL